MKLNMGSLDRILRIVIALVITGLFIGGVLKGTLGIVLMVFAVVFVMTSFIGFCPLYTLFGGSTCKRKS
ncbi:DUF2892 domain-containing protein [bacterium]|nr:DUF2892 domain-containing protein [bacterium]